MTFKTMSELKKYIISHSKFALKLMTEQVYQVINKFIKEYYADFSPEMYDRTYQLFKSLVKTDVKMTTNGCVAYVYFDFQSLVYFTGKQPSGSQVMKAAAKGDHGAEGLHVASKTTVGVWDNPIDILDNTALEMFKKNLIASGIPIK